MEPTSYPAPIAPAAPAPVSEEVKKLDVDWYIHGSTAMVLSGIDVAPNGVDIIFPNYSDFDMVRNHFNKFFFVSYVILLIK